MNYNNIKTEDFSLITKIRQSNDSEAFRLLFIKYRPP